MTSLKVLRLELTSGLGVASRQWMRLLEHSLGNHGVSAACAAPLILIGRSGGGINQIALAEELGLVGPSLVRLLDKLCVAKFVRRARDPADRRAKTLWLTEAGQLLADQFEARLVKLRAQVFAGVPAADLEAALRVHRMLSRAAADIG